MSWDYCEYPEFYHETFPKSRKTHSCVECSAPIEIGEMHLYYRGKWDGEFGTGRQHMLCRSLCMYIRDQFQSGECFGFGDLASAWSECGATSGRYQGSDPCEREFSRTEQIARNLMARVRWRERKFVIQRKKVEGVFYEKPWGKPWVSQEASAQ